MSDEKLKLVKLYLVALAEYLQVSLTDDQVIMYANEFNDPDYLAQAILRLKADPDIWPGKFPLPAKIKSYMVPDAKSDAKEIAVLIMESVNKFGKQRQKEAKEYMGLLAWEVCHRYSSFSSLCDMTYSDKQIIFAQLRDVAENTLSRRAKGFEIPRLENYEKRNIAIGHDREEDIFCEEAT